MRDNLPRNTPAIYTPAATFRLRYSRELLPIVINLLLSTARKNYRNSRREREIVESTRISSRHPGALQVEVGKHDRICLKGATFRIVVQGAAVGVIKKRNPAVGGFLCIAVIRAAKHERRHDEGSRVSCRVGKHQLPGHTETITHPGVAWGERILTQFHQHTAGT